jgi:hypothetical protein
MWSSSAGTDDGGTFIVPDPAGRGHVGAKGTGWRRIYSDELNARWFGAGCGGGDDTQALNSAIAAIPKTGGTLLIPAPITVTSPIYIEGYTNLRIRGLGMGRTVIIPTDDVAGDSVLKFASCVAPTVEDLWIKGTVRSHRRMGSSPFT